MRGEHRAVRDVGIAAGGGKAWVWKERKPGLIPKAGEPVFIKAVEPIRDRESEFQVGGFRRACLEKYTYDGPIMDTVGSELEGGGKAGCGSRVSGK
jgi:hypothetical protein